MLGAGVIINIGGFVAGQAGFVARALKRPPLPVKVATMNESSPHAVVAPSRRRRFPFRYVRLALALSLIYGAMFIGINALQGRFTVAKLPTFALVSGVFGVFMTLFFVMLEARAMKRLGIPLDNGEGVPKSIQRREILLPISHSDAVARVEAALFVSGIVIERRDPEGGVFEAITGQTWKGYGEKLRISLAGQHPVQVTVESRPRLNVLGLKIDYGKGWENVEAIQSRLLREPSQGPEASDSGLGGLCLAEPPKFFEVGAWQRLLPVQFFYVLALFDLARRISLLPESTPQLAAMLLVTLPVAGIVLELWGYAKFRSVARDGPRIPEQETMEAMLNNSFPVLFALGLMLRPQLPVWAAENIIAILFAGIFVYFGVRRTIERGRERVQRLALAVEREKFELQRQLAEAKLVALSAQIEPHFLFNTLASIQYLIRHDADKAHALTSDLIRYLRLALPRMKQATAPLADELQLVKAYLAIMQIRMGSRLRFNVDEEMAMPAYPIPTMVLITLVENAIKHGLERKPDGGEISVTVKTVSNNLEMTVADTGGGFSTAASGTGIGLANIRERLKTLYGERGQLELAVNEPCGVKATITIPMEKL
jgi:two-component sensor histidine kinase